MFVSIFYLTANVYQFSVFLESKYQYYLFFIIVNLQKLKQNKKTYNGAPITIFCAAGGKLKFQDTNQY